MTTSQMYEQLNSVTDVDDLRSVLKGYLEAQLEDYKSGSGEPDVLAQDIAGLMSAQAFANVPSSDPLMKVLETAGQLELPPQHRSSTATWDELEKQIRQLD